MTSAGEVFVVQLARASRKAKHVVRSLQRADRDDVIAAALLWCWRNRDNFSLTTTLDTWFVNAVKHAFRDWYRGELKEGVMQLNEIPTGDTTQAGAEALEAANKLMQALPYEYRRVAILQMKGYTWPEMVKRGVRQRTIDEARVRIKQLRKLLPDDHEYSKTIRRAGIQPKTLRPAAIDTHIAQLEAMPKHGKDCPPCWRCKWFEGYLPGPYKSMRMPIQELEVRDAVRETEARKIAIAKEVRNGNL